MKVVKMFEYYEKLELGKLSKARGFANEDTIALNEELIRLRHKGVSVLGANPDLPLIDLSIIRCQDIRIWKHYNLVNKK